ncbi:MAG: hypothetical protein ACXV3D_05410 [Halobacteriota archaeon]
MGFDGEVGLVGYRSVDHINLELDGEDGPKVGWVVFEIAQGDLERTAGALGTINNYETLKLLRLIKANKTIRIRGVFKDGVSETSDWTLDRIVATGAHLEDTSSFIGFRAVASRADGHHN